MNEKMKLIERLVKDGHIGLDEALVLLESEKETIYVQLPQEPYITPSPWAPPSVDPFKITINPYMGGHQDMRFNLIA